MVGIHCVVFDLDDTLYLERDYVKSGFRAVADAIGDKVGNRDVWFAELWNRFLAGVRGDTFNQLLLEHPLLANQFSVSELVGTYRTHAPRIALFPEAQSTLVELRELGYKLGLITDGPLEVQQAKVRSLELHEYFDHLVLTGRWGNEYWKPHPRGFLDITQTLGVEANAAVYIGDNPEKDFVGARHLGWTTVRLRMEGQLRSELEPHSEAHAPEHEFLSWHSLRTWLLHNTVLPA